MEILRVTPAWVGKWEKTAGVSTAWLYKLETPKDRTSVVCSPCDFQFHLFQWMFIHCLMKMIYINNKHCEKSADAVCYRITWKNNDERHQALMRHLELHIKRQPGVFLHSLGNWCLSLMPGASCWKDGCCDLVAKWEDVVFEPYLIFFLLMPGAFRLDRDASLWTETLIHFSSLAMRCVPPKILGGPQWDWLLYSWLYETWRQQLSRAHDWGRVPVL